jgi:hypothetical protein
MYEGALRAPSYINREHSSLSLTFVQPEAKT